MSGFARFFAQPLVRAFLAVSGLGLLAAVVVHCALGQRLPPDRCPDGMVLSGERCCGVGQHQDAGRL